MCPVLLLPSVSLSRSSRTRGAHGPQGIDEMQGWADTILAAVDAMRARTAAANAGGPAPGATAASEAAAAEKEKEKEKERAEERAAARLNTEKVADEMAALAAVEAEEAEEGRKRASRMSSARLSTSTAQAAPKAHSVSFDSKVDGTTGGAPGLAPAAAPKASEPEADAAAVIAPQPELAVQSTEVEDVATSLPSSPPKRRQSALAQESAAVRASATEPLRERAFVELSAKSPAEVSVGSVGRRSADLATVARIHALLASAHTKVPSAAPSPPP